MDGNTSHGDREELFRFFADAAYRSGKLPPKGDLLPQFAKLLGIPRERGAAIARASSEQAGAPGGRRENAPDAGVLFREILRFLCHDGAPSGAQIEMIHQTGEVLGIDEGARKALVEETKQARRAGGPPPPPVPIEERLNRAKAEKLVAKARQIRDNRDFEEAIALFKEALVLDVSSMDAWRALARTYQLLEDYSREIETLHEALRHGNHPWIHTDLGYAFRRQNLNDEALAAFRRGIREYPRELHNVTGLAMALIDRGDYAEAEQRCREAMQIDPGFSKTYECLAMVAQRRGSLAEALKYYERAEQLAPGTYKTDIDALRQDVLRHERWSELPSPSEMIAYLDRFVCSQQEAKRALAGAIYGHYLSHAYQQDDILHGDLGRFNVMLFGPSGCGKTYMIELLTKRLGVPLALISATSLVQTGYVGKRIDSIISDLLAVAGYDVPRAERGIVFIDEIDKVRRHTTDLDVSGEGVQNGLLTMLEGKPISVHVESKGTFTVDTSRILFIAAGAFDGITDICRDRRTKSGKMGFGATSARSISEADAYRTITVEDLETFGMIPQLIGRFSVLSHLNVLTRDDLRAILSTMEGSVMVKQQKLFELHGVALELEPAAIEEVLDLTCSSRTGARGLRAALNRALDSVAWRLDRLEQDGVSHVRITAESVKSGAEPQLTRRPEGPVASKAAALRRSAFGARRS